MDVWTHGRRGACGLTGSFRSRRRSSLVISSRSVVVKRIEGALHVLTALLQDVDVLPAWWCAAARARVASGWYACQFTGTENFARTERAVSCDSNLFRGKVVATGTRPFVQTLFDHSRSGETPDRVP